METDVSISDADPREQIARLETHLEELAQSAERCRKIALASRVAIVMGAVGITAMALGAIRFGGAPLIFSAAAIIGGIVVFGANSSTAKQVDAATRTAEALRAQLIGSIGLRLVVGGSE
jgi:hypothetical protein